MTQYKFRETFEMQGHKYNKWTLKGTVQSPFLLHVTIYFSWYYHRLFKIVDGLTEDIWYKTQLNNILQWKQKHRQG